MTTHWERSFGLNVPYLFELRHPVPRPNFQEVSLFKKSKDQSSIGTAHDKDFNYESSPGHVTF